MKIIKIYVLFAFFLMGNITFAQMTKEAYLAQLEAYKKSADAGLNVFFDNNKAVGERILAVERIDMFKDKQQAKRALAIVLDQTEPDRLRAAAIFKVRHMIHHMDEPRAQVLRQIEQSYSPPKFREAAIDVMQMYIFKPTTPDEEREIVLDVFRKVATTDAKPEFRERAMYTLINYGDAEARRILGYGLRDPADAVIAPDKAITLLSGVINDSDYYYNLIFNVLKRPPSDAAQLAAMRALGNYLPAQAEIARILQDESKGTELRIAALSHLNATMDKEFLGVVESVITDEKAPEALRIRCMQAQYYREVKHERDNPTLEPAPSPEFEKVIKKAAKSPNEDVKKEAKKCNKRLRKQ